MIETSAISKAPPLPRWGFHRGVGSLSKQPPVKLRDTSPAANLGDMNGQTSLETQTDEQLAVLVQSNNTASAQAYTILYKRHAPALLAFLAARTRDRAEASDLCQQVWVKVWEQLETHFQADHFRGWVFQMARNLLIDHHRRKRPAALAEEFDRADRRTPEEFDCIDARVQHLQPCVEALAEERRAIVAARLAGRSFEEISSEFGIPSNTAMTRFHRAKDQLRDCIEQRSAV
ncbi:MAG: RNA polymerase sigma factor [Planctomycetaceae bacterium]